MAGNSANVDLVDMQSRKPHQMRTTNKHMAVAHHGWGRLTCHGESTVDKSGL